MNPLVSILIPCHNAERWIEQAITIASKSALDRGVVLLCSGKLAILPQISIGKATYINRHTFIDTILSITIGQHCAIGPNCYITDRDHGMNSEQPMIAQPTKIGDRVWLGAKVTLELSH
jgi:acetyltransferase-like isoleucine patch superfamily enzyme